VHQQDSQSNGDLESTEEQVKDTHKNVQIDENVSAAPINDSEERTTAESNQQPQVTAEEK